MHREGLWEQTITEDGKARVMGGMRICLGPAVGADLALLGEKASAKNCRRQAERQPDGSWRFQSVCHLGLAGEMTSVGEASGDFTTHYRVRAENTVSGSHLPHANGRHIVELDYRWLGPCPAGMTPGQVAMRNGWKVDLRRLTGLARAVGAGA